MRNLLFILLILLSSCNSGEKIEKSTVKELFIELKKQKNFNSDLTESVLLSFFENVNIGNLKNEKTIDLEYLFEKQKCECLDKISLSFSEEKKSFNLIIHESYFESDLDWCPETSYFFSFKIDNKKIRDVKLEQIAG